MLCVIVHVYYFVFPCWARLCCENGCVVPTFLVRQVRSHQLFSSRVFVTPAATIIAVAVAASTGIVYNPCINPGNIL